MKMYPHKLLAAGACLAVLCVAGCSTPGLRQAVYTKMTARAHIYQGVANYYEIEVTRPTEDPAPGFWLRLPDNRIIDRTWFTYANLKKAGSSLISTAERG